MNPVPEHDGAVECKAGSEQYHVTISRIAWS
jgi:hypothetical protein